MIQYWKKLAGLIDERNTRERVLMFATTIIVITMLMQALFLGPVSAQIKRLSQEMQSDQAETVKLVAELQSMMRAAGADPDAALKARLAELQLRQLELQRQIDTQSADLVAPEKMASVLEKILVSNRGLQLIEVKTLPLAVVSTSKEPSKAEPGPVREARRGATEEKKPPAIYRHGVQVTVRGGYLNLLAYLKEIEALPVRMYWEQASLAVGVYPEVTMRIVVYTISPDKVWLTV